MRCNGRARGKYSIGRAALVRLCKQTDAGRMQTSFPGHVLHARPYDNGRLRTTAGLREFNHMPQHRQSRHAVQHFRHR